ncbi:MAG: hypothetical protein WC543_05380 [Candidatus Omnitrophota bacterium]
MNKHKRLFKYFINTVILLLCLVFVIKFAGGKILKQYIIYGIGDCKSIPLLCLQPDENIFKPEINPEYLSTLVPHNFPKMSVDVPKGFNLVQELIKRKYYKKRHENHHAVIYLLFQEPKAFINLYPDLKKQGILNNYEFIRDLNSATLNKINNLTDAFFIIMKSVFTPDIGNQGNAKMIKFELNNCRGFISYTMNQSDNYFDCNIVDADDNFFKVYIKDIGARLDLNNVFAIISTLKSLNN